MAKSAAVGVPVSRGSIKVWARRRVVRKPTAHSVVVGKAIDRLLIEAHCPDNESTRSVSHGSRGECCGVMIRGSIEACVYRG